MNFSTFAISVVRLTFCPSTSAAGSSPACSSSSVDASEKRFFHDEQHPQHTSSARSTKGIWVIITVISAAASVALIHTSYELIGKWWVKSLYWTFTCSILTAHQDFLSLHEFRHRRWFNSCCLFLSLSPSRRHVQELQWQQRVNSLTLKDPWNHTGFTSLLEF